jgi:hypothetical protein
MNKPKYKSAKSAIKSKIRYHKYCINVLEAALLKLEPNNCREIVTYDRTLKSVS